ncbi:MAG: DUF4912 domain-containing protein [Candidatus Omnitrophica bacterium]|nr:DUF4912 domain-containing protein [Candidatus Omnitrophota bacterium]
MRRRPASATRTRRPASREPKPAISATGATPATRTPPSVSPPPAHSVHSHPAAASHPVAPEEKFSIPTGYGDDLIALMVKDPFWLYAYWEIQPATERAARSHLLPSEIPGLQSILRVYDVTGIHYPGQPAHRFFDIGLSGLATNWYIQTDAPGRSFIVEIGLLTKGGKFLLLARSNRVTAPRWGPSDVIDEAWMTTDDAYWKLFGMPPGIGGSSPSAWGRLIAQQLSSAGGSSVGFLGPSKPAAVRGFWCRVNTDLIIHGATEPKATVVVQGQPVVVRKDGTFSLRVALPEGTQTIAIDVTSSNGQHTRTITPIVNLTWSGNLASDPSKTKSSAPSPSRPSGPEHA